MGWWWMWKKCSFSLRKNWFGEKSFWKNLKNEGVLGTVVLGPYRGPIGRGETESGQEWKKGCFSLRKRWKPKKMTIFDVGNWEKCRFLHEWVIPWSSGAETWCKLIRNVSPSRKSGRIRSEHRFLSRFEGIWNPVFSGFFGSYFSF